MRYRAASSTSHLPATSAELDGVSGKYLLDCRIGESGRDYLQYALDATAAEQLWELSEKLVGQ